MRKAIFVFVIICCAAGNAFAQLTFSGEAYAGVQLEKKYDMDETIDVIHRDKGGNPGLPKFDFMATALRDDYGMKADVIFQYNNIVKLNGVYGWVNFFNNAIRLTMGQISDAVWVSCLDADHEYHFDDITGFRVQYNTPIDGLNLGAAFPTQEYDTDKFIKKVIFGASYVHPYFNTIFAYDVGNNARALFGFNFTGIDELTSANLQVKASNLATWDNPLVGGVVEINEKIGYRVIRPLTIQLLMEQKVYGEPDKDASLAFIPGIAYRIIPGLVASLDIGFSSADYFTTKDLMIRPCLEYTLKGPALFYVEYELKLEELKRDNHKFGFGMDIKAF